MKDFNRWLFGYGSPLTFGVFRAIMGSLIFLTALFLIPTASDFYSEAGYAPSSVIRQWNVPIESSFTILGFKVELPFAPPQYNPLMDAPAWVTTGALWLLALAALCTALGLFSRVSSILLFALLVAVHHRDPIVLNGGDTLQRACAFYLAIGPSGAAFSLDQLLRRRRGKEGPDLRLVSLWPQRLIQINMAIIYLTTVWLKWQGPSWKDGTATWYTARLGEFQRFPVPDFLTQMPMVRITTYGTLIVELSLATLVFSKDFRKWVLLAGLVMHAYIEYSMNIPLFAFSMCALYIAFYQGEEIQAWWDRVRKHKGTSEPAGAAA